MSRRPARTGLLLLGLSLPACAPAPAPVAEPPAVRTVVLTARNSRFTPAALEVAAGSTVRLVVRNLDPIAHELIVGDAEAHDRHERGTGTHDGTAPGEVSVAAGSTAETTYRFDRPGRVEFGCHLPGHWSYGMRGTITVL